MKSTKTKKSTPEKIEIECEHGDGFQEYVFKDSGKRVPAGTPIGYEIEGDDQLHLYDNILYSGENDSDPDTYGLKDEEFGRKIVIVIEDNGAIANITGLPVDGVTVEVRDYCCETSIEEDIKKDKKGREYELIELADKYINKPLK